MKRSYIHSSALSSVYKHVHLLNRGHWKQQVWRRHDHDDGSVCSSSSKSQSELSGGEEEDKQKQSYVNKSQLFSFLQFVKPDKLSASELVIHTRHIEALERGDDTYKDPPTGNVVFTRLAHLRRGNCCGSACRHCPYGHKAVPPDRHKNTYNSAFYT